MGIPDFFRDFTFEYEIPLGALAELAAELGARPAVGVDGSVLFQSILESGYNSVNVDTRNIATLSARSLRPYAEAGLRLQIVVDSPDVVEHNLGEWQREAERARGMKLYNEACRRRSVDGRRARMALTPLIQRVGRGRTSVPPDLVEVLETETLASGLLPDDTTLLQAPMQADHQLAHLCAGGEVVAVLTTESTVCALGARVIRTLTSDRARVVLATLDELPPKYLPCRTRSPRFSYMRGGTANLRQRAVFAALLGCDTKPGGLPKLDAAALQKQLDKLLHKGKKNLADLSPTEIVRAVVKGKAAREPVAIYLAGADALMYEHVVDGEGEGASRRYLDGCVQDRCHFPTWLRHLVLPGQAAHCDDGGDDEGSLLALARCARGHSLPRYFGTTACARCRSDCCDFCKGETTGVFVCSACDGVNGEEGVDEVELDREFASAACRGLADGVEAEEAVSRSVRDFLTPYEVGGRADRSDEELLSIAQTIQRGLRAAVGHGEADGGGGGDEARAAVRRLVDDKVVPRKSVYWAYEYEAIDDLHLFNDALCYEKLELPALAAVGAVLASFLGYLDDVDFLPGSPGPVLASTLRVARPGAQVHRWTGRVLRAAAGKSQRPLTSCRVGVVRADHANPLVMVRGPVCADEKAVEYTVTVWLDATGPVSSACACAAAGRLFCTHAFILLRLIETEVFAQSPASLSSTVVDAFVGHYPTHETAAEHQRWLIPLVWQAFQLPVWLRPVEVARHLLTSVPSRESGPFRPRKELLTDEGFESRASPLDYSTFDPFVGTSMDVADFDYVWLRDRMVALTEKVKRKEERMSETVFFRLVELRATEQEDQRRRQEEEGERAPSKRGREEMTLLPCVGRFCTCVDNGSSCPTPGEWVRVSTDDEAVHSAWSVALCVARDARGQDLIVCPCEFDEDGEPTAKHGIARGERMVAELEAEVEERHRSQQRSFQDLTPFERVRQMSPLAMLYTGFPNADNLEFYLDFLCNGDRERLRSMQLFRADGFDADGRYRNDPHDDGGEKCTLSIEDQLLLYCQFELGVREDAPLQLAREFRVSDEMVTRIVMTWAAAFHRRWQAFGTYPTYSEYARLCPKEWWQSRTPYAGRYTVLWDTVPLRLAEEPTDADTQRLTSSDRAEGNFVLQAGLGMTPFSWLIPGPVLDGCTPDAAYLSRSGVLARQEAVARECEATEGMVLVCDKALSSNVDALAHGQSVVTPPFRCASSSAEIPVMAGQRVKSQREVLRQLQADFITNGRPVASPVWLNDVVWQNFCLRTNMILQPLTRRVVKDWEGTRWW